MVLLDFFVGTYPRVSTWQVVARTDAWPGQALLEQCQETLDAKPILSTRIDWSLKPPLQCLQTKLSLIYVRKLDCFIIML
jgi:hypothetical protein